MLLKSSRNTALINVKYDGGLPTVKRLSLANVLKYLKEYCTYSTIHGFRYLSEEHRNGFEKLFWATAIIISAIGCVVMIAAVKTKMDTTPMIITMAENPTKVWHVPFPAVTVCPGSPSRLTAFNLTKFLYLSVTNQTFLEDFLNWINESKTSKDRPKHDSLQVSDYNKVFNELSWTGNSTLRNSLYKKLWALYSVGLDMPRHIIGYPGGKESLGLDEEDMEFLVEVSPKMNRGEHFRKVIRRNSVRWKSNTTSLDAHFRHLWTHLGLCFAFNMMDNIHIYRHGIVNSDVFKRRGLDKDFPKPSNDWDPDKGYSVLRRQTYPWRAPHERRIDKHILTVMMMEKLEDINEFWGKGTSNFVIMFHQPQDHPFVIRNPIYMPFYKFLDITVNIDVMTTSPKLVNYDPQKRQCYYSHEKHLKYFKFYSQGNCQFECVTNLTLKMCGCVAFFMPRFETTKICGRDAHKCAIKAIRQSDETEMDAALKDLSGSGKSPFNSPNTRDKCDCLPSCLSVSYDASVLTTRDLDASILQTYDPSDHDSEEKLAPAGFQVGFKTNVFTASQRKEYYGQLDFLANCGGFLGLFCGFSILSFIEILYFMTIRLWTNVYRSLPSKPPPGLPGGLPDAEDPARRLAFNIPPPVDFPLRNSFTTCVCEKLPAGDRMWRTTRHAFIDERHWTENIQYGFRR